MSASHSDRSELMVTLWLDPVCPFSWNTARWLRAVAEKTGLAIDLRMMNLAVLNEGRQLPPAQQARMNDSRQIGRLMSAVFRPSGACRRAAGHLCGASSRRTPHHRCDTGRCLAGCRSPTVS
jgi:hypothetical protein